MKRDLVFDGLAVRSYREISAELRRRFGWKLAAPTVHGYCRSAERKIAAALAGVARETVKR